MGWFTACTAVSFTSLVTICYETNVDDITTVTITTDLFEDYVYWKCQNIKVIHNYYNV